MRERILGILTRLKAKAGGGLVGGISDFKSEGKTSFELTTRMSQQGHRTWLKYESTNDSDVIRIEITHWFGYLDLTKTSDPVQFLLEMSQQNVPSFRNSSTCLGVKVASPYPLINLNATHHFLDRMSDEDIADILSIVLFDLATAFMFEFPPPIVMWDKQG